MGGGEAVGERVGNVAHAAVFVAVGVVDGLDASARRGVVFGGGHLELAVVGKGTDALHQALSVGARAHDGGAVIVLQGARDNLRGRCAAAVHQHQDGNFGVDGVRGGLVNLFLCRFPLGGENDGSLGNKERDNVHGFVHHAAAVAAKVQHQAFHPLGFEFVIGIPDFLSHAFGEFAQEDVAVGLVKHVGILQGGKDYALANDGNVHDVPGLPTLSAAEFLHPQHHRGAGLSAHFLAAVGTLQAVGAFPVDGLDLVPAAKARTGGRGVEIRLVDDDVSVHVRLVDDGAHTSVGAAEHHLEIFLLFFRNINGIGVQGSQHCVDGGPLDAAHFQGVHIGFVQFLENGVVNLYPFAQGEVFGLRKSAEGKGRQGDQHKTDSFHNCTKVTKNVLSL